MYYYYILLKLMQKCKIVYGNDKRYFVDNYGKVLATLSNNIITMFYAVSSNVIFNHSGYAAVSIVKNFNVNNSDCDVLFINGLCGSSNDVRLIDDYFIESFYNIELSKLPLYIKENKTLNVKKDNISDDNVFGTCGSILNNDGQLQINVFGDLIFGNIDINLLEGNLSEKFNLFILSDNNITKELNYDKIYQYHLNRHNYYYRNNTRSKCFSHIYSFDERRKSSNVDEIGNIDITFANSIIQEYSKNMQESSKYNKEAFFDLLMFQLLIEGYSFSYEQSFSALENDKIRKKKID